MKPNIHPPYKQAQVGCVCGNIFTVGASVEKIQVESCSRCHPVFSGRRSEPSQAGQVERFRRRAEQALNPV